MESCSRSVLSNPDPRCKSDLPRQDTRVCVNEKHNSKNLSRQEFTYTGKKIAQSEQRDCSIIEMKTLASINVLSCEIGVSKHMVAGDKSFC